MNRDRAIKSGLRAAWRRFIGPTRPGGWKAARPRPPLRIGLALGGGFARGIAHVGILNVFERHHIPIHCITGVSAGSIVAAAYASGASPDEIGRAGCAMRFRDIARWQIGRMGFVVSDRMKRFLERLLKVYAFEKMRIPLGVAATDLCTGEIVRFHGAGDVVLPIRASCSYPGLFRPVPYDGRLLVDGAMSVETPADLARQLGATRVVSVCLTGQCPEIIPGNMFEVVNRCFQILQNRADDNWRRHSDIVLSPAVSEIKWDGFGNGEALIQAGEAAALEILPRIQAWLEHDRETPPEPFSFFETEPAG